MQLRIENALAECMDAIDAGQLSVEEALERYPELREELAPLMRATVALQQLPRVEAPAALRQHGRARLMERIAAQQTQPTPISRRSAILARLRPALLLRPVAAVAAFMMVFAGTLTVSADSLPGDALYPIKLFGEQAQLATAVSEVSRAQLHLTFAERRLAELEERGETLSSEQVEAIIARYQQDVEAAEAVARNTPEESVIRTAVATATARRDEVLANVTPPRSDDQTVQPSVDGANPAPPATEITPVDGPGERQTAPSPSQRGSDRDLPGGPTLPPVVVESGRGHTMVHPDALPELKTLLDEARGGQQEKITKEVERYVSEVARLRKDAARPDDGQHSAIASELTRQRQEIEQVLPTLPVSSQSLLQPVLAALAETDITLPGQSNGSERDGGSAPRQADRPVDPVQGSPHHPSQVSSPLNGQANVANAGGSLGDDKSARMPRWSPSARGGPRNVSLEEVQDNARKPAVEMAKASTDKPSSEPVPDGRHDASSRPSLTASVPSSDTTKSEIGDRVDKLAGRLNGRRSD